MKNLLIFLIIFANYLYCQGINPCSPSPLLHQDFSESGLSSLKNTGYNDLVDNPDLDLGPGGLPKEGAAKILIIYAKFCEDDFDSAPETNNWPSTLNSLPSWATNTISPSILSKYSDPSISGYYKEMSMGKVDLIGSVCPVLFIPSHPMDYYYFSNGRGLNYLTEEALNFAANYVNFADYDIYDPNDLNHNHVLNEPDGRVDFVAICFRNASIAKLENPNSLQNKYQGICSLTGNYRTFGSGAEELTFNGKTISAGTLRSGTFQTGIYDLHTQLPVILHEIGHYYFGLSHSKNCGHFSLMDGNAAGLMNAYERSLLGWINTITLTDNSNVVFSDFLNSNTAYKKLINNTNNDWQCFYFYYIGNSSYYETQWRFSNSGTLVNPGFGVVIIQAFSEWLGYLMSAQGNWDWVKINGVYKYPFEKLQPNPFSGKASKDLVDVETTQGKKIHSDFIGTQKDLWNIGYNEVFDEYSNPSSIVYNNLPKHYFELIGISGGNTVFRTYNSLPQDYCISKPQFTRLSANSNGRVLLNWSANLEPNISFYEISRKEYQFGNTWQTIGTTTNNSFVDNQYEYMGPTFGNIALSYRVTCHSSNIVNHYSIFSDNVNTTGEGLYKSNNNSPGNTCKGFILDQNYPNPFNPSTTINYQIPNNGLVILKVYDILGNEIKTLVNENKPAGRYSVSFNAGYLSSGVYIYKLNAVGFVSSKIMMLIK